MKHLNHIFLFVFLAFFGKSVAVQASPVFIASHSKELSVEKFKAKYEDFTVIKVSTSKVNRQKRPKKPKGIPVIVPNLTNHVFHKFCHYSNYSVHEVKGDYSLLLHYSHGMRGPPVGLI